MTPKLTSETPNQSREVQLQCIWPLHPQWMSLRFPSRLCKQYSTDPLATYQVQFPTYPPQFATSLPNRHRSNYSPVEDRRPTALLKATLRLTLSAGNSVSCMFSHLPLLFFRPPSWLPRSSPIVTRDALRCSSAACLRLLCSILQQLNPFRGS